MAEARRRARRMEERLLRVASERGLDRGALDLLGRSFRRAVGVRARTLPSDHHPAFLHPARTALILLDDVGETRPATLVLGVLAESRSPELRVPAEGPAGAGPLLREAGSGAQEWWDALPQPEWDGSAPGREGDVADADARLLEELVTAPEPVRRVALAEALDHLRHAHRWEREADRIRAARLARGVFGPLSARVHPQLERRLAWWNGRVGSTLDPDGTS